MNLYKEYRKTGRKDWPLLANQTDPYQSKRDYDEIVNGDCPQGGSHSWTLSSFTPKGTPFDLGFMKGETVRDSRFDKCKKCGITKEVL